MMDPRERKNINEQKLKAMGIAVNANLPFTENISDSDIKSFEDICRRAVAALLVIQIAFDASEGEYEQSIKVLADIIDKFGVKDSFNAKEQRVYDGTFSEQDVVDVVWEYESYWALVWALGLIDDEELIKADGICDCNKAIHLVSDKNDMEGFMAGCKLKSADEIMTMLDLFYRMHWACVDKRIRPETAAGDLVEEVVMERRRGLEWLVSNETDWYDISLNT
ncbi:MAG: DUF4272 domain-containing protein [Ruminococcus sp.]|nr:DUF4272 domain-containing protein [Ruminococcus sp.]